MGSNCLAWCYLAAESSKGMSAPPPDTEPDRCDLAFTVGGSITGSMGLEMRGLCFVPLKARYPPFCALEGRKP